MNRKTKGELIKIIEELEEKIGRLENDVDYWEKENADLEDEIDKLNEQLDEQIGDEGIKSLENFIWKLKLDNLYTDDLERFIEYYMKFYNK